MKQIEFHRGFVKDFKRLNPKIQKKFWERLELWQEQPTHPLLNHHTLTGKYAGKHSINISGDVRAIYEEQDETIVIYLMIGTHSQLYG
jgi:addiction module RelE/StbE family toxin